MPRQAKPPRLWLLRRKGRSAQWVILHDGKQIVTGALADDLPGAERALADYLGSRHQPDFGDGHPAQVLISDVLAHYAAGRAPSRRRADLIASAIERLDEFFAEER